MPTRDQILDLIRTTVWGISPTAQIYLFGSRARGDYHADSDWDVLVLIDAPKLTPEHKSINFEVWDKGQDLGQEINCIIRTVAQWEENISMLKYNIRSEGIKL